MQDSYQFNHEKNSLTELKPRRCLGYSFVLILLYSEEVALICEYQTSRSLLVEHFVIPLHVASRI